MQGQGLSSPGSRVASLLRRRPSSDVLWLIGSQAVLAVGQLAGVRILTETVRPEIYGTVSIVMGLVVFGRSQFAQPFAMAAMRQYAEAERGDRVGNLRRVIRYWLVRAQGLAGLSVLAFGVPYCLYHSVSVWLPVLTFGLFVVDSEVMIEASFLNASQRHRAYSLLRGSEAWIKPILAVALVELLRPTAPVVLTGYLAAGLILVAAVHAFRSGRREEPGESVNGELLRRVWRFSLPLFPIAPVEWVSSLSDRYFIGGLVGLDAAGIYAACYGLISQPFLMAQIVLENYYRPHYYNALADRDAGNAQAIFTTWFALTAAVCGLGLIGVIALKSWIVTIFLAESYRSVTGLLFPIALGNSFFALSHVTERYLYGKERTELCLVSRTVGAIMSLAAGVPMIFLYGIHGAAWAAPIYYGFQLASALLIVWRVSTDTHVGPILAAQDA